MCIFANIMDDLVGTEPTMVTEPTKIVLVAEPTVCAGFTTCEE